MIVLDESVDLSKSIEKSPGLRPGGAGARLSVSIEEIKDRVHQSQAIVQSLFGENASDAISNDGKSEDAISDAAISEKEDD